MLLPSLPSPSLPSLLRFSPLRTTTEIGVVTGSSSLPVDNSLPVGLLPTSRKRHLFPGDDKEEGDDEEEAMWPEGELFDDILGLLSGKFLDNLCAGEGQRDPLPSEEWPSGTFFTQEKVSRAQRIHKAELAVHLSS